MSRNPYYNEMFPHGTEPDTGIPNNPYQATTQATGGLGSFEKGLGGPLGMLGGTLGGVLGGLFGQESGPSPMSYLSQITGQVSPYLKPYSTAGQAELGPLAQMYGQLASDPGQMLNKIGGQFHQSPGFNFAMQQAMRAANQGAAAGGMAGSPEAQQNAQRVASGLASQNYYNWLNQAKGMFGQGLQGMQGLAGMGLEGGMGLSEAIANALAAQASQAQEQQAAGAQEGGGIGGVLGDIAGAAMHFLPI